MMQAQQAGAYGEAELAVRHAEATGDDALTALATTKLALATADLREALPLLDQANRGLRSAGALGRVANSLAVAAWLALVREDYDDAEQLLDDALAAAAEIQHVSALARVHGNRGVLALLATSQKTLATPSRRRSASRMATPWHRTTIARPCSGSPRWPPPATASQSWPRRSRQLRTPTRSEPPASTRPRCMTESSPVTSTPARESLDTPARKRAEARGRALTVAAAVQLAAGLTPDATG